MTIDQLPLFALIIGTLGILATWMTYAGIKKQPAGSDDMQRLAGQIHTGALAFLRREYTVLLPFLAIVAVLLGLAISLKTGMAYVARKGSRTVYSRRRKARAPVWICPASRCMSSEPAGCFLMPA